MEMFMYSTLISFVLVFIFMLGLKTGINLDRKKDITLNPIKVIKEQVEVAKQEKEKKEEISKFEEGLSNIMDYNIETGDK